MNRTSIIKVHVICASLSALLISTFITSTVAVEIFGGIERIKVVKGLILMSIPLLILLLFTTNITGVKLGVGGGELVKRKKRRAISIALIGLFILTPCAYYLYLKAQAHLIDGYFILLQTLEITFGLINLFLILKNVKTGRQLRRVRN